MALQSGARLGSYEILGAIGAGGMGEVYRAHDPKLQRDVAIKALPSQFSDDPERVARFEREAQALAALNHPGIAGIHELLEHEGSRFLVLEFVEGETLAARIARGPLPLDEALPIAKQIAEALEAAHEKGIVHRDLKPANIIVSPDGRVKVLDFGLAKALDRMPGASGDTPQSQSPTVLTISAGVILGTAPYMSPEQARGKPVDRRADIWAFGCVLFEMLTARRAFAGETVSDAIGAVLRAEPDWSLLPANTPANVHRVLRRCVVKDPHQRLPHIGAARIELVEPQQAIAEDTAIRRSIAPWAAVAVVAGIAIGAGTFLLRQRDTPQVDPVRFDITTPPGTIRLGLRGSFPPAPHYAVSPDGRSVVFSAVSPDAVHLWLRPFGSAIARKLSGTEDASFPFWSPDGQDVAFFAHGALKRVNIANGVTQIICQADSGEGGSWGPDGTIVFAPTLTGAIWRVPAAGGAPLKVTAPENDKVAHRWPFVLPDGRHFLYLARAADGRSVARLRALADPADDVELLETPSRVVYAAGFLLFRQGTRLLAQFFDVTTRRLEGTPIQLLEAVDFNPQSRASFHASDAGVLVYRSAGIHRTRLVWRLRNGAETTTYGETGRFAFVALSPDGTRAVVPITEDGIQGDLWLYDLVRNVPSRFTTDTGLETAPLWSRDGTHVVYATYWILGGGVKLWIKAAGGAEPARALVDAGGHPTDWTPDGRSVVVSRQGAKTQYDVWVVPTDGSQQKPLLASAFNEFDAHYSRDGRWLAYVSDEAGQNDIYVQPVPLTGQKWRISPGGGEAPQWTADGRELLFFSTHDRNLSRVRLEPGAKPAFSAPEPLFGVTRPAGILVSWFAPAPDGQRILMIAPADSSSESLDPPLSVILNFPELIRRAASQGTEP